MKINNKLIDNYMVYENHIIKNRCGANGATDNYTYSFGNRELYTIIVAGAHSDIHYSFKRYLYNAERNVLFIEEQKQQGNVNLSLTISGNTMSVTNTGSYGAQYEVLIF